MARSSSAYLWAAIAALTALLFVGAWLGLRSVADSVAQAAPTKTAVDERYARYVAPADRCPGADSLTASAPVQQQTTICLLNYARRVEGLPELSTSPLLMRSAELKAAQILRCEQFSHEACGSDVRQSFADSGYFRSDVQVAFGENLAWGGSEAGSPRGALLGWLDSAEHRANLFKAEWREQGLALAYAPSFRGVEDSRIWVSHFGRQG